MKKYLPVDIYLDLQAAADFKRFKKKYSELFAKDAVIIDWNIQKCSKEDFL